MPHSKVILHFGGSDLTAKKLRTHVQAFPNAHIEEINIKRTSQLPLLPKGVTHNRQDFLHALKAKPDNSVDQIHSEMALGYYRKAFFKIPFHGRLIPFLSERSRAATNYACKVLNVAYKKLKDGGHIEIVVSNCRDTYCLTNGFLNIMSAIDKTTFEKDKIKVREVPKYEAEKMDYWVSDTHQTLHSGPRYPIVYKITLTK